MFYPICIYGFIEDSNKYIIDSDVLSEFNCYSFIEDISNKWNSKSGIYYGIQCSLDKNTGQLNISDEDKQLVHDLYQKYVEFKKNINQNLDSNNEPEIGYYCCIDGDLDFYNKTEYNFEDSLNEDEDDNDVDD